mmetsp:Transcript_18569/g.38363  ORF Transcript_18569/g.38363 Transcript_18569/m.38363 type:complete len:82 (+) Transcript_18569:153-398(+)
MVATLCSSRCGELAWGHCIPMVNTLLPFGKRTWEHWFECLEDGKRPNLVSHVHDESAWQQTRCLRQQGKHENFLAPSPWEF